MELPTFREWEIEEDKYIDTFGRACSPVVYEAGEEPAHPFLALVMRYCLAEGKPYEEIIIGKLVEWLATQGLDSTAEVHWRPQVKDDDDVLVSHGP